VVVVGVTSLLLIGGAGYAATRPSSAPPRVGNALAQDLAARSQGQQVLGEIREPGVPTVQRLRHDDVQFTVTVAPARPGPNLVRVDAVPIGDDGATHERHLRMPVRIGTSEENLVAAGPRPGADGLWAVVDLPEGSGTLLVTHGPRHRVPFAVDTGPATRSAPADAEDWTGSDGPECVSAATATLLAGGADALADAAAPSCPASELRAADRAALASVVDTLATRGVEEVAVRADGSPRSRAASAAVTTAAEAAGVRIVAPDAPPGPRNALVVVSGWQDAAEHLAAVTTLPPPEQPIRSDGTWLAPWLLSPGVVDSTSGAVLPLDFDIRDDAAQQFSQTLATLFPGQAPTSSAYAAWREAHGADTGELTLYAAARAAYLPRQPGHVNHETEVAWFPGGTVTPVGALSSNQQIRN
jgi:hypothetical protein